MPIDFKLANSFCLNSIFVVIVLNILVTPIIVALLITFIMKFSLNKINKQNIIETIRKDNI